MSKAWTAKRFWTEERVEAAEGGFVVLLDARVVNTPGKQRLVLPTRALAEAVAAEWAAQEGAVKPETMPMTRTANSALEKVAPQRIEVADMLASYGGTDLLCYRAERPQELIDRQAATWDPLIAWAEGRYGVVFRQATGVMPVDQPAQTVARLTEVVRGLDAFALAGFHDLVALSGSLILGLGVLEETIDVTEAWAASRVDETWQVEQWGHDEEADRMTEVKAAAFRAADRFCRLVRQG
jgi:chaperone required for assembly of F1-ATPase